MESDHHDMQARRELAVLLFALKEGDTRLAELIASALRRGGVTRRRAALAPCAAGGPAPEPPPRTPPEEASPLAQRTLDALIVMLGLEERR